MGRKKAEKSAEVPINVAELIEMKPVGWFKPYKQNARTHSETQLDEIAASIATFGFLEPVLARGDGTLIGGHGRIEATTTRLDLKEVPTIIVDHLSDDAVRALVLALNKIALNAGWDEEILESEVDYLVTADWDMGTTGFDEIEIEDMLGDITEFDDLDEDEAEEEDDEDEDLILSKKPVSKLGDLWILGNHRLICGDSTKTQTLDLLLQGERPALIHTDPPYNVDYSNAARPKAGKKDHGKIENDKMEDSKFYEFLLAVFKNAFEYSDKNTALYVWYADKETMNFLSAVKDAGFRFSQTIIWKKPMLLGRSHYQWAHEPCLYLTKGSPHFTENRKQTTVWDFGGYDKSKNEHPTQKPLFLPEQAIENSSKRGQVVLDFFGGSGSTLLAAEKAKRKCRMIEIDPAFCDVIVKRWQRQTGLKAILETENKTFADMKAERIDAK